MIPYLRVMQTRRKEKEKEKENEVFIAERCKDPEGLDEKREEG